MTIIAPPVPTSVYRYYDRNDLLLYVGITSRGINRNREHNSTKAWWRYVNRQEVEHYPHRLAAEQREKHLIRKFRPPYNTQHNPDHDVTRAIYEANQGRKIRLTPREAMSLFGRLNHRLPLIHLGTDGVKVHFGVAPEHEILARELHWKEEVLLLAPKKVAQLLAINTSSGRTVFTFKATDRNLIVPADVKLKIKCSQDRLALLEPFQAIVHSDPVDQIAELIMNALHEGDVA